MPTSAVPSALDAIIALLTAALPDVDIHDGPPTRYIDSDWVAVGFSPAGDTFTAVDSWSQEARGLGQQGREERFDVVCSLASTSGDAETAPRRTRAFELLAGVEAALRADSDLTGTVRFGELSPGSLSQERGTTEAGRSYTSVGIEFRISVQARL